MNHGPEPLFPDFDGETPESEPNGSSSRRGSASDFVSSIWSFPGSGGDQLYRWYGTLPHPLVQRLLGLYATNSRTRILDLFMGLGTTLNAAVDANLAATGLDVNPLACLAAEARLFGMPSPTAVVSASDQIARSLGKGPPKALPPDPPEALLGNQRFAYMRKWFREDTLQALLALLFHIAEIPEPRVQRLQFVAAAQVAREVASVDPRCTHHLVTKVKPFLDPVPLWRERVRTLLATVREKPADPVRTLVIQGSALQHPLEEASSELVLIHPPYLGVIHYHLIHRLATDLLDIVQTVRDPVSLRKYRFDYATIKSADVSTDKTKPYQGFVKALAGVVRRTVPRGGRCVVIIGDQRYQGHLRHPFTDFISQFEGQGFTLEENFIWVLQNNGGMHVLRRGHFIDHNYILVFHQTSSPGIRSVCPSSSSTSMTPLK
jgi:hypothetical protein